jgi:hypothetical protein
MSLPISTNQAVVQAWIKANSLNEEKRYSEALAILRDLIDQGKASSWPNFPHLERNVNSYIYEKAAAVCRKLGDPEGEIAILEDYRNECLRMRERCYSKLLNRLDQAYSISAHKKNTSLQPHTQTPKVHHRTSRETPRKDTWGENVRSGNLRKYTRDDWSELVFLYIYHIRKPSAVKIGLGKPWNRIIDYSDHYNFTYDEASLRFWRMPNYRVAHEIEALCHRSVVQQFSLEKLTWHNILDIQRNFNKAHLPTEVFLLREQRYIDIVAHLEDIVFGSGLGIEQQLGTNYRTYDLAAFDLKAYLEGPHSLPLDESFHRRVDSLACRSHQRCDEKHLYAWLLLQEKPRLAEMLLGRPIGIQGKRLPGAEGRATDGLPGTPTEEIIFTYPYQSTSKGRKAQQAMHTSVASTLTKVIFCIVLLSLVLYFFYL